VERCSTKERKSLKLYLNGDTNLVLLLLTRKELDLILMLSATTPRKMLLSPLSLLHMMLSGDTSTELEKNLPTEALNLTLLKLSLQISLTSRKSQKNGETLCSKDA